MTFLIFDTETTGLTSTRLLPLDKQPDVIEFFGAVIDLELDKPIREGEWLIKPRLPITGEITRITGIDDVMVADAPVFADVASSIKTLIEEATLVCAHNASFDKEIIDLEFERLGQTVSWPLIVCTVEQTIHLLGFRLSLTALHEHLFGERFPEAHRARNDVAALVRCVRELWKRGEL